MLITEVVVEPTKKSAYSITANGTHQISGRSIGILFAVFTVLLASQLTVLAQFEPERLTEQLTPVKEHDSSLAETMQLWLAGYRGSISKARGPVCNFEPSCSHYFEQAIEQYGFFKAMVMTGDRLQRCHQCMNPVHYPRGFIMAAERGPKFHDLPKDNDVWCWFGSGERKYRKGLFRGY